MTYKNDDKSLLILDLDETLIHATAQELERKADFGVFDYHVYKRPFLDEFLQQVSQEFLLAVWSSASDDYVMEVVKNIFPSDMKLEFVWGRSRATFRRRLRTDNLGYFADNPESHYHYTKPLQKLKRKGYNLNRILIVDDTPRKCMHNYGNAIYPAEYLGSENDEELRYLSRYLSNLKEIENVRNIEKRGWINTVKKSNT